MMTFKKDYFIVATILFLTEVLIAAFMHDQFIRPYFGDYLVVILMYCFVKSFLSTPVWGTAIIVLLISYMIELVQFFHILNLLGLEDSKWVRTLLGWSFEWIDMIAYTAGIITVLIVEHFRQKQLNKSTV